MTGTEWQNSAVRRLEMENRARLSLKGSQFQHHTPSRNVRSKASKGSSRASSKMTVRSSKHGRKRRGERSITKLQLQRALKHGRRVPLRQGVSKYVYKGITFVYNDFSRREITSYVAALDIPYKEVSQQDFEAHKMSIETIRSHPVTVTSHSVLLVDTSGSMRNSDVQGSRSRLSAVFLSIAEDFIKPRITSKIAGATDAISLIQMGEGANVVFSHLPTDWYTYNKVLEMYKDGFLAAKGHCCYQPSLQAAQDLLSPYDSAACQLCLVVFSDGRPSDSSVLRTNPVVATQKIIEGVEFLASTLGNRLSVQTIGFGSADEFTTLEKMAEAAKQYGSKGQLQLPNFSSSGLRAVVSSISTELTESQLNSSSGPSRIINVKRENQRHVPALTEAISTEDFEIFSVSNVRRKVYDHYSETKFREVPLQHPDAKWVGIHKKAFGEGSERFAFQFFELAADGVTVVGDALVAKTTRFIDQDKNFLKRFSMLQYHAQLIAEQFNTKLDSIPVIDCSRIEFLRSSVYEMSRADGSIINAIVEPLLSGKWQKWNSNNGWAKTGSPKKQIRFDNLAPIKEEFDEDIVPMECVSNHVGQTIGSAMTNNNEVIDITGDDEGNAMGEDENIFVSQDEVAQAFSHFSYVSAGRKLLLCDLQGAICGRNLIQFTDPVIHSQHGGRYGKTDRGAKGIEDFLDTHQCNILCECVTTGFFPARLDLESN